MPCYNEEDKIRACLVALTKQECVFPYEIVVVDDDSNDGTVDQVNAFMRDAAALKGIDIKLILAEHGGPSRARNMGIKNARGEIVLLTDADCIPSPKWVQTMVERIKKGDVAGVAGTYATLNPAYKIADYIGLDIEYRHSKYGAYTDFAGSYNASFKKSVLEEVGWFDESFSEANAEDSDLSYRILERGYKIAYEPKAWVGHPHPTTLTHVVKQQFKRAAWRVFLYKKRPKWIKGDKYAGFMTLFQPLFFAGAIILMLTGLATNHVWLSLIVVQVAVVGLVGLNLPFISWVYRKRGFSFALFASGLTILRVISWCLGAISGTIKFLIIRE